MKGFLLSVFAVLLLTSAGFSQQQSLFTQYKFNRLTENEGLTNNIITDIIQDTLGHIWVGTEDGLFRYMGGNFKKFMRERDNGYTLPNNHINGLYVDHLNDLWILTQTGVGKYSYQQDAVVPYHPETINKNVISMVRDGNVCYLDRYGGGVWRVSNDSINALPLYDHESKTDYSHWPVVRMDKAGDMLWMAFLERGILGMDLTDGTFTYFSSHEICGKDKLQVFEVFTDRLDRVWLGTDSGPFFISEQGEGKYGVNRILPDHLPADDYLSVSLDLSNNLWLGTRQNGLFA